MLLFEIRHWDFFVLTAVTAVCYSAIVAYLVWRNRQDRLLLLGGLSIALLLPLGWYLAKAAEQDERTRLRSQFIGLAPTYAEELRILGHTEIVEDSSEHDPRCEEVRNAQKRWLNVWSKIKDSGETGVVDIYTFRLAGEDRIRIVVDSENDLNDSGEIELDKPLEQARPMGTELTKDIGVGVKVFGGEPVAFDDRVFATEAGNTFSTYAPIADERGRIEAAVCVEFKADQWIDAVTSARLSAMARLFAFAFVALGAIIFVSMLRADIRDSDRKEAELREAHRRAKAAALEARKASEAKAQFLANMSHEIRTPMNGVIGMSEILLQTDLTREQHQYQSLLLDSARSLLDLLNDILDFSKIEAGKIELESIPVELHDFLAHSFQTLGRRVAEKNLDLVLRIEPNVPHEVLTDPTRLKQVLTNLVSNAVKFTHEGEIEVSVSVADQILVPIPPSPSAEKLADQIADSKTSIGEHVTNENLRSEDSSCDDPTTPSQAEWLVLQFAVRDTGIGIPESQRTRIFESFTQADASTTRDYGGTGLGLAICSNLTRLMGGEIWLESEVCRGSTFFLQLPVIPQPTEPPSLVQNLTKRRLLVADDNESNRIVFRELLQREGFTTEIACDGVQTLDMLRRAAATTQFDLLLLDLRMPRMNGYQVLQAMANDPALENIPVIVLSSMDQLSRDDPAIEKIVRRQLLKPTSRNLLLKSVSDVLSGQPSASDGVRAKIEVTDRPRRVLLSDDAAINRTVARKLLERRGHIVTTADDGLQTVELWRTGDFDIVMMDIQMPHLDGFGATQEIRRLEAHSSRRTPIVAMTAHALQGDRERCLDAGMDGYVSKPFRPHELFAVVESLALDESSRSDSSILEGPAERALNEGGASAELSLQAVLSDVEDAKPSHVEATPRPVDSVTGLASFEMGPVGTIEGIEVSVDDDSDDRDTAFVSCEAFDRRLLLENSGGDDELARQMIEIFLEDSNNQISRLAEAVGSRDGEGIRQGSHLLRGSVAILGASRCVDLSREIETLGDQSQFDEVETLWPMLQQALDELLVQLRTATVTETQSK